MAMPELRWIVIIGLFLLAVLVAYAWIDGGREPVREMSHTVPLPENY